MNIARFNLKLNKKKNCVNMKTLIALFLLPLIVNAQEQRGALSLNECIEIALRNNPNIVSSSLNVEENRIKIKEVEGGLYPTFNLNASAGRNSIENQSGGGFTTNDNLTAGLSARYPIFQGFKTTSAVNAATENYNAGEAQHKINIEDLIFKVTESYYNFLQTERVLEAADKSVERTKLYLNFAEAKYQNGLASQSDLLKAKVEYSNAGLNLIRAKNARLSAMGSLNTLLGKTAAEHIAIVDNLEFNNYEQLERTLSVEENISRLLEAAYEKRPEVYRLKSMTNAQKSNLNIARSEYLPTLTFDANYNYFGEETSDLRASTYLGLSLNLPLFNGFSSDAKVDMEKIALRNLEQQDVSLRNEISLELWKAYLAVKESIERINNNKIFYENALENLKIAEGEYKEGVGSMLSLVDAQTNLITAEESYIEALADYGVSLAFLKRASGIENIEEIL